MSDSNVRVHLSDRKERYRKILKLGLPIVGGMISQNILNLVDTGMVGSLGDAALAAVGTGSFLNFMSVAFITGFSSGVQAMVARRKGEGRDDEMAVPLNGALLTVLVLSIPWSILLYASASWIYPLVNDAPDVVASGVPYLEARLLAILAVGINFSFRGYWNGINRPSLYLQTLLVMHATNIGLNWLLIFGNWGFPKLGAEGAGIASAISTYVGTGVYFYLGLRHARGAGFLRGLPDRDTVQTMWRISLPTSIQQFLFSAGFTVLFWILGQVGTAATAAGSVLINVMLVAILPCIAFGMASTSLVGQALGRKDPEDAYRWGWDVVTVTVLVLIVVSIPMVLFPDPILDLFIRDPETIRLARWPLRIIAAAMIFDAVGMVLLNAHLGAGASRTSMAVTVGCQWLIMLPGAYLFGPVLGHGLLAIWIMQAVYRIIQAGIFAVLWRSRRWAQIEV